MDSERNDSDLEEDPELEALRMAALATLKSRAAKNSETEKPVAIQSTLNSAPYNRRDQAPGPLPKGQNSWRNPSNQQRGRGRGRGIFPKVSPRSNLIVITPVSTEEKNSTERISKPSLTLPQHRWCQPVNEDSSSPKTKRGPTRFNRHESGSESSDSEYDKDDQDSYSNETILQDENSTNFPQMTNDESNGGGSPRERTLERRLSFQNTTVDERQDDAKATSASDVSQSSPNDCDVLKDKDVTSYSSYKQDSYKRQSIDTVNGVDRRQSEDSFSGNGTKTTKVESADTTLTNNDLRLALKQKMSQSKNGDYSTSEILTSEIPVIDSERSPNRSRPLRTADNTLQTGRGRNRFRSSSQSDSDREQSCDQRSKRYTRRSPERKFKRESSSSPNRNGKHSWSRSPVKRHSLDRKNNNSRSPSRNRTETQSPIKSNKSSHSPLKSRKRSASPSPNRRFKRNSRSPYRNEKNSVTERNTRKEHKSRNDSPKRNLKKDSSRSPYIHRKRSTTRSPERNNKNPDKVRRTSPYNSERKPRQKISWSPDRNRKQNSSQSPERKNSYSRRDRSRSPIRAPKRVSSSERSRAAGRDKYSRHRSSRSSSSLSSSSESSHSRSTSPCVRSISSVIKPVLSVVPPKVEVEVDSRTKRNSSSDSSTSVTKGKDVEEKPKMVSSLVKSSIVIGENRFNAPEGGKRLPVHMRLGTLPRNKIIRMTKDVEAAFVNSSSDDDVNDGKKQNLRVEVNKNDIAMRHVEKSPVKIMSVADSKSRKKKAYR